MKWKKQNKNYKDFLIMHIIYSKFLSISLEHLVEHKPLIYEEWCMCFEPGTCQYKKVIGLIDDSADVRGRSILIASPTDINSCITYF